MLFTCFLKFCDKSFNLYEFEAFLQGSLELRDLGSLFIVSCNFMIKVLTFSSLKFSLEGFRYVLRIVYLMCL